MLPISEGDRIALVGNAFFERELRSGRIETVLTLLNPGVAFKLRNFAWSGDTVWGESRAEFDTAKEGYGRLLARVAEFKPTLIIVGYGLNESFKGESGLVEFKSGLKRLIDDLIKDGARLAFVSPLALERLAPPMPDPAEANHNVKLYADAIAQEASARKAPYLDLLAGMAAADAPLTDDGVHLTDYGYSRAADAIAEAAGLARTQFGLIADFTEGAFASSDKVISGDAKSSPKAEIEPLGTNDERMKHPRFKARLHTLPYPAPPESRPGDVDLKRLASRRIVARGLAPGKYRLEVDGKQVAEADATAWAAGVEVNGGPEAAQVEALRRAIVRKNELWFHRWRPQNDTYLFLFRKHEQGQNAAEIPRFDPLVDELDAKIVQLSKPNAHVYEFIPVSEAAR